LSKQDAAFDHLRMAIERGYPAQLVRDDPELAAVKASPGFEAAISAGQRARTRTGAVP